ncbi:MAG: TIGR02206 family membrane protein [Acidobacteria bacterium]|nr:MAG: TIGR02206 family membrane protein [Acidobacteriota bacterium]PYY21966.1 MAG: TIGR02206 family membrane protein [Acidobacteriota bacterium]
MSAQPYIRLFGPTHLLILINVPVCAAGLSWMSRRKAAAARWTRFTLAALLTLNGLWWYWYRFRALGVRLPQGLPFELCDISLWLAIYSLLFLRQRPFELAYYWGLGAAMAVLTPDLLGPLRSASSVNFFLRHGGTIVAVLYLICSNQLRPSPRSWRLAFFRLNLYAVLVACFDFFFGTNYLYLRNKPASASLLNAMGQWPIYILGADLLALIIFLAMAMPFRESKVHATGSQAIKHGSEASNDANYPQDQS